MLVNLFRSASLLVALCSFCGTAGARAATTAAIPAPSLPHAQGSAARGLPGIHSSSRSLAAVAPSYTIDDIGAPPGYATSYPDAFNNTGQIFGDAEASVYGGDGSRCYVWSGTAFIILPLGGGGTGASCNGFGINDADATTGEYEVVGSAREPFAYDYRAFASIVGPKSVKRTTVYYANAGSVMVGVSGNGTALAIAYLDRDTPLDKRVDHYFTAAVGANVLTLLQILPSPNGPPVHTLGTTYISGSCPFGGCLINDHNFVLGFDQTTIIGTVAMAAYGTVGQPYALGHLPFTYYVEQINPYQQVTGYTAIALNNVDQLVRYDETLHVTSVYDIDTGIVTTLPVAPPNCADPSPHPMSMNDHEEVLMVVTNCHRYTGYYTWDPVHGTQYLNSQLPVTNETVQPLGVNDSGAILVRLTSPAGVVTWGTLNPVAATQKTKLRH